MNSATVTNKNKKKNVKEGREGKEKFPRERRRKKKKTVIREGMRWRGKRNFVYN